MAYTDIDKPSDYFNTKLYTGNGSSGHAITGVGFQPDWIWIKDRGATNWHSVRDSVRGTSRQLFTNETRAEETASYVTAFNSDGFTLGTGNTDVNANNNTYASWNWKAGTSFTNDASSTGIGSIDSTGSVNTDAGFSIMTYTGTGSNATFAHGLSAVPKVAIFKDRSSTGYWMTYHQAVGNGANLVLNTSDASSASSVWWNSTSPTSSVFSIGTSSNINVSGRNYVGYLFAEKQGYSKFSSYVGTGVDSGTFSFCGFKPSFVLTKRTDTSGSWVIQDNKRPGYNETSLDLNPNNSEAEETNNGIDMLSNGFKQRNTDAHTNASGGTYIYMAFAEQPFVTSSGVPATAR